MPAARGSVVIKAFGNFLERSAEASKYSCTTARVGYIIANVTLSLCSLPAFGPAFGGTAKELRPISAFKCKFVRTKHAMQQKSTHSNCPAPCSPLGSI